MKMLKSILVIAMAMASVSLFAEQEFGVDLGAGWRHVDMKGCFKEMDLLMFNAKAKVLGDCYYGRLDADYGWMKPKHKKDCFDLYEEVEFHECSSQDQFCLKTKQTGYAYDLSAAVGFPFSFDCGNFQVIPVVGYSYHRLHQKEAFRWNDSSSCEGEILSGSEVVVVGEEDNCSSFSSFDSAVACKADWKWHSPFIGVDLSYKCDCIDLFAELEYHTNFWQFKKYAQAFVGTFGARYNIDCNWSIGVVGDYRYFTKSNKKDHSSSDFCSAKCCGDDVHGEVHSWGARVEIGYLF